MLKLSPEVAEAIDARAPLVALETTIVAHGFPLGEGLEVGRECEARVRAAGAVPATVAVLDGELRIGLTDDELQRVASAGAKARKVGPRDLGTCIAQRAIGATTVGGTIVACRARIEVMATGGIGGVHRGYAERPDVSADVGALADTPAIVVCSGVKSILDVTATAEVLETLGVPVLGWRTDELPLFYAARGGPTVSARVETVDEVAKIWREHRHYSHAAALLAQPPADGLDDVEPLIAEALAKARAEGVSGQAVTPFLLAFLHDRSGGRTLEVNRRLAADNAALAAEVAVALSG